MSETAKDALTQIARKSDARVTDRKRPKLFSTNEKTMSKALTVLLLLAMLIQVLKPLNLPGLRHRRDFWKIAVFAIAVMMVTVLIRP
ncbi:MULTISPECIES: hypothetical protein [unclassified Rhizobium]|uniref:hypothetical protein n=1 Tax=unclassified Rhizobium TaxID=2613769 RepID=UPI00138F0655|nr:MULTISPECIES: hypothetical protein [unclassified Rhizobium]